MGRFLSTNNSVKGLSGRQPTNDEQSEHGGQRMTERNEKTDCCEDPSGIAHLGSELCFATTFKWRDLRVSMELMRHSSSEMTLATYGQTVCEKREAGEKMASLVLLKKENAA